MKVFKSRPLLIITGMIVFSFFFSVFIEAAPYNSYTYNFYGEPVPAPQAYVPGEEYFGMDFDVGPLKSPQDVFVDSHHNVYIVDTGNHRIICLDENLELIRIIEEFDNDGETDTFDRPSGIFISEEGDFYIADTENERLVILNEDDQVQNIITKPETEGSEVLEDTSFKPLKVVVDYAGRIYLISQDVYQGLMEFESSGEFNGFTGAPRVDPSVADYFWKMIATEEQRSRMSLFIPVQFSGVDIDKDGFIYTSMAGGQRDIGGQEVLKKINSSGEDILRRNGFHDPVGDIKYNYTSNKGEEGEGPSIFEDVVASAERNSYSVLDITKGRVFTYDDRGRLLYVFGGMGNFKGLFRAPSAIDMQGDKFLILDSTKESLTTFKPTDYTKKIHAAIKNYNNGRYNKSASLWRDVHEYNTNYDIAYSGIGRNYWRNDKYFDAMRHFKLGQNRDDYSKAYSLYRREVLKEEIGLVITVLLLGIVLISATVKYHLLEKLLGNFSFYRKYKDEMEYEETDKSRRMISASLETDTGVEDSFSFYKIMAALRYSLYVIFHPFDGFWDLKHEKKGNIPASVIILLLLTVTYTFMRQYTGFIFNTVEKDKLNILTQLASVVIPFVLWFSVNWALTTLMDGKGTLRDIFIASAFSLVPVIIINIPVTVISNFLTVEEGSFYYFFITLSIIWTAVLLIGGTLVTHDYTLGKTLFTTILIIIGMGTAIFIGLLFFRLVEMVYLFFSDIYSEIVFRM